MGIPSSLRDLEAKLEQHCRELDLNFDEIRDENVEIQKQQSELEELLDSALKAEFEVKKLRNQNTQMDSLLAQERATIAALKKETTTLHRDLLQQKSEFEKIKNHYETQMTALADATWETEIEIRDLRQAGVEMSSEVLRLRSENTRKEERLNEISQAYAELRFTRTGMEEQIELLNELVREQDIEMAKLSSPEVFNSKIADLMGELLKKEKMVLDLQEEVRMNERAQKAQSTEVLRVNVELKAHVEQIAALQLTIAGHDDAIAELEYELARRDTEMAKVRAESLQVREELEERAQLMETRERQLRNYAKDLSRERADAVRKSRQLLGDLHTLMAKITQDEPTATMIPPLPPSFS